MLIQIVLLAAVAVVVVLFARHWNTTRVAHLLGVGRGTDLVLYLLVVAVTLLALNTYLRFRAVERRLTELARDAALRTAHRPEPERPLATVEGERTP